MALNKNKPSFESDESELANGDTTTIERDNSTDTKVLSADEKVAAAIAAKAGKPAAVKEAVKEDPKVEQTETAATQSTSTAVAAPKPNSLAVTMAQVDPFTKMENAIKVDYNTLTNIMVTNGNVQNKDTKQLMGDSCVLELISIQKHWVMSPGGESKDKESLEFLKFSDDGVTVRGTGQLMTEAQELAVAAGYKKARINERRILVGMMVDAGKLSATMNGELVQMDLAPRSMANFHRHRVSTTFRIGKGLQTAEGAEVVKIGCDVKSENGNNWTDAIFSSVK